MSAEKWAVPLSYFLKVSHSICTEPEMFHLSLRRPDPSRPASCCTEIWLPQLLMWNFFFFSTVVTLPLSAYLLLQMKNAHSLDARDLRVLQCVRGTRELQAG